MNSVFIVAGEASGDLHGANLIKALKKLTPSLRISCSGGVQMRALADGEFIESAHLNATGITEVLKLLPQYAALFKQTLTTIRNSRPDLVILIDNPGFNLRLAKKITALKIPIVYYICPQIWAWNAKRIHTLKQCLRKALVVFDFETDIYKKHGVPVTYVGHPLRDEIPSAGFHNRRAPVEPIQITLMPGSRTHEVENLLPVMLESARIIQAKLPKTTFHLVQAPTLARSFYEPLLKASKLDVKIHSTDKYKLLRSSDLCLVCSGTATLECALMDLPMIVLYRASWLTFVIAKLLTKVRFLSIPNILAKREIVPELLQYNATAPKISEKSIEILTDHNLGARIKEDLTQIGERIGYEGASTHAAREVAELLNQL